MMKNPTKSPHPDSMVNGVEERGLNKVENLKFKVRRQPSASSLDIIHHIKPSVRKEPDEITIHVETSDVSKMLPV